MYKQYYITKNEGWKREFPAFSYFLQMNCKNSCKIKVKIAKKYKFDKCICNLTKIEGKILLRYTVAEMIKKVYYINSY